MIVEKINKCYIDILKCYTVCKQQTKIVPNCKVLYNSILKALYKLIFQLWT